jgi:hypothetical protein
VELGRQRAVKPVRHVTRDRLAAHEHGAQRRARAGRQRVQEGTQNRGNELHSGDVLAVDQLDQPVGVGVDVRLGDHERGTGHQRDEDLPDRDVEADRCLVEVDVAGTDTQRLALPEHTVADAAVLDHRALRPSRGAGRMDHVGDIGRCDVHGGRGGRHRGEGRRRSCRAARSGDPRRVRSGLRPSW